MAITGGLLGGVPCPNGHGPMENVPGIWALNGVQNYPNMGWVGTNQLYTVTVYRCLTCGNVQLRDKD